MQNTLNKVFPGTYICATFTEYIALKKVQFKKKQPNKQNQLYTRDTVLMRKIMIIN